MTIGGERLERLMGLLRAQPGFEQATLASPPEPLTGGYWAEISRLQLANVAPPVGRLVLRVMPDDAVAAKETVLQGEIFRQRFPVPAIRLAGDREGALGEPFLVMDEAPGRPPFPAVDGLDALRALRRLPSLGRRLPVLLAEVAASLHALDPMPARAAVLDHEITAAWNVEGFVALLTDRAAELGRTDLVACAGRLDAHPPPAGRAAICHGDLHPFNLLLEGERWTLLDWSTALIAEPAYDLAFTALILRYPPLAVPAPLRPVMASVGAAVARRFLTAYRRISGGLPPAEALGWYTGLHALRILVELEGWEQDPGGPDRAGHPWTTLAPTAERLLARTTSTTVGRTSAAMGRSASLK